MFKRKIQIGEKEKYIQRELKAQETKTKLLPMPSTWKKIKLDGCILE